MNVTFLHIDKAHRFVAKRLDRSMQDIKNWFWAQGWDEYADMTDVQMTGLREVAVDSFQKALSDCVSYLQGASDFTEAERKTLVEAVNKQVSTYLTVVDMWR